MSSETLACRILEARYPKTKSKASMVLDFPDPFGPTIDENDCKTEPYESRIRGLERAYLVKGSDLLSSSVTLEIDKGHFVDDEA